MDLGLPSTPYPWEEQVDEGVGRGPDKVDEVLRQLVAVLVDEPRAVVEDLARVVLDLKELGALERPREVLGYALMELGGLGEELGVALLVRLLDGHGHLRRDMASEGGKLRERDRRLARQDGCRMLDQLLGLGLERAGWNFL